MDIKEILKYICMIMILFIYIGGFIFWSIIVTFFISSNDNRKDKI